METAAASPFAPALAASPAQGQAPHRPHLKQALAGGLALVALAALAWTALAPPATVSSAVTGIAPSARLQAHFTALAAAPRPIATPGNAQARDYVIAQLRAAGLTPDVQRATVRKSVVHYFGPVHMTIGVVHNIVVRIPGTAAAAAARPALLLATHYDSSARPIPADGVAAAAMLEAARALHAAPPRNDVVLLFADGEQVGGLGAKGFVEQHPLARRIGLALNFDSTHEGPLRMADASAAGGAALAGWIGSAPELRGSSLEAALGGLRRDVPRVGPLGTLATPVLLFAGGGAAPVQLEDAMLRLVRAYGATPLAQGRQAPHAWFALPGFGMVHHPVWLTWVVTALACAMLAGAWRSVAGRDGAIETVQAVFGTAFLLLVVRIGSWNWRDELEAAGVGFDHRLPLQVMAVAACVVAAGLYLLRRSAGTSATVLGALAWPTLALIPATVFLPATAHVLAWPVAAAIGAAWLLLAPWGQRQRHALRLAILVAGLAPAAVIAAPALRDTWLLLAPARLYLPPMLLALPMLCLMSPLLALRIGPAVALTLALLMAACFTLPLASARPVSASTEAPAPIERLVYHKDMNSWRAYWLLPPQPLDAWTRALFTREAPSVMVDVFGWHSPRQWHAVAPRDDAIFFPDCAVLVSRVDKVRLGAFTVRSKNRAPQIAMWVSGAKPLRSRLDGQVLTANESNWSLTLYGMEDRLLRFEIETAPEDIFAVTVQERIPGLPRHLLPPRPAGAAPLPAQAGQTVSTDILRFYR